MAENEITKIAKVSEETKAKIRSTSAQSLPNNPSAHGMTADQIKAAFYKPIIDGEKSLIEELDRVVDEANASFAACDERIGGLEEETKTLEEKASALERTADTLADGVDALHDGKLDRISRGAGEGIAAYVENNQGQSELYKVTYLPSPNSIAGRNSQGYMACVTPSAGDQYAANIGFVRGQLAPIVEKADTQNERIDEQSTRIESLATQVLGNARSYVIEGLEALSSLLAGRWTVGETSYSADALVTGDNILLLQKNVPDFWFEATSDTSREAETYTYTDAEGNERTYVLRVWSQVGTSQAGLLHILESDYTVIEGYSKSASRSASEAAASAKEARESAENLKAEFDAYVEEILLGGAW